MKMIKFMAFLMAGGLFLASCSEEEEKSKYDTVTFEGEYFASKIDTPQFYGPQLYGDGTYSWTDSTTSLSSKLTNAWGDGMFWGGGIAISNYINTDVDNINGSDNQLTIPVSNGSEQFAIVYCNASVYFADSIARTIKSMDICPNNYLLNVELNGDNYAKALTEEGDFLTLNIVSNNNDTVSVDLARDGNIQKGWKRVDLSKLGKVQSLNFSMTGSDVSNYGGINTPTYFALDNVKIAK